MRKKLIKHFVATSCCNKTHSSLNKAPTQFIPISNNNFIEYFNANVRMRWIQIK